MSALMQYGKLRQTHPRLGKAAYGSWIENLNSEDWGGQQVVEILDHLEEIGTCPMCFGREHRQVVVERVLVGANRGLAFTSHSKTCLSEPSCGSSMQNSGG